MLQRAGDPKAALKTYEAAAKEDRQSVEALSNLAVALNQTGQGGRAQAVLQRAQALDPQDPMTAALLRQVRENLAAEQDGARQKYIDDTVREYCERLGPGGGWVLGSSTSIMEGIPPENFVAMTRAVHKYGRYGALGT